MWNNPNDPMPIKTMNMAGLQKWEETDDYIIYIDKDAVMTTVAKYAPGSYQTFMERKADVDNSRSLLRGYNIEWTQKDDSDLFIQCNNEAISKIENQPMTLDEPTQPIVLEPKTVPTTYECCFRVDKKTGEFYIGEGYENLFSSARKWTNVVDVVETTGNATEGWYTTKWIGANRTDSFNPFVTNNLTVNSGDVFSFNFKCKTDYKINLVGLVDSGAEGQFSSDLNSITASTSTTNRHLTFRYQRIAFTQGWQETVYNICITKTSTPKPFVKSMMPSGKLAFVTPATSETHSFVMKGFVFNGAGSSYYTSVKNNAYINQLHNGKLENITHSKTYKPTEVNYTISSSSPNEVDTIYIGDRIISSWSPDSFTQLLIYKGNLTEAELKAELAKNIKII